MRVKLNYALIVVFIALHAMTYAQINNYWSMGSNTSSTLLGGAVVGGGAGDVAIFYNPAAIRVVDQKQIALNASLLNFDLHSYENALGNSKNLDYLEWGVKPRFLSYQYKIEGQDRLSIQLAVFSRDEQLVELYDYKSFIIKEPISNEDIDYTASYDLTRRYSDYWAGIGASYMLNEKFSIGATLFGSGKSLRYYQSSIVDVDPLSSTVLKNANWTNMERQYLYVISLIPKIGLLYEGGKVSMGLNITLPSMRLWGDGYSKRTNKYSNVFNNGQFEPDYLRHEYNNYMVANIKEPLAIAYGITFHSSDNKSKLFFTMEYFAPIKTYRMLDDKKISTWGQDEYEPGTDFLTYKYGAKQVFNVAIGFRHQLRPKLALLSGLKTNFSAYDPSNEGEWSNINEYIIMSPSYYHASLGAQFRFKANTVILGAEYSFGKNTHVKQLANYGIPMVFDEQKRLALQKYPENTMNYISNSIGFYIGYAFDF